MAHKYHARRTEYAGQWYDSLAEARRALWLDAQLAAGQIRAWCRPAPVVLLDAARARDRVTYRADFHVVGADGSEWWEDVKGVQTPVFRIKLKLWKARYPDRELRVIAA